MFLAGKTRSLMRFWHNKTAKRNNELVDKIIKWIRILHNVIIDMEGIDIQSKPSTLPHFDILIYWGWKQQ